jgi:ketosteroid isomerase-like protein
MSRKTGNLSLNKNYMKATLSPGGEIFRALLKAFALGAEDVVQLFHKEAVIEYPYAPSLGTSAKHNKDSLHTYLTGALPNMPDLIFSDVIVYPLQKEGAFWAEALGECTIRSSGLPYRQKYIMYFELRDGLFSNYREYWDLLAIKQAFGNNGDVQDTFR